MAEPNAIMSPLSFPIGTPLQIQIDGFRERFKTSLVGIVRDEYLILETPEPTLSLEKQRQFTQGSEVVVRCISKGTVWGFKSTLERVISTPTRLLVIGAPRTAENHSLRAHQRIECLLPGQLLNGKEECSGMVLDISEEGCLIAVQGSGHEAGFEPNSEVRVKLQLPGLKGEQTIQGFLRHISADQTKRHFGIQFNDIDPKIRDKIAEYVAAILEGSP